MKAQTLLNGLVGAVLVTGTASPTMAAADPVIDLHAHVFNLRYLPVQGILVARGVPKPVAAVLDRLLVGATTLSDLSLSTDALLAADQADLAAIATMDEAQARQWVIDRLVPPGGDRAAPLLGPEERRALLDYVASELQRLDRLPIEASDVELVDLALDKAPLDPHERKSYRRFLATLMQGEVAIVQLLERDYPDVDLFVHHLMDLEQAYADPPDVRNPRQLERMAQLEQVFPGQLLGFVAFDPFRRGMALDAVHAAIDSGRALGVKYYPPSGYKPAGNDPLPTPPRWWRVGLREQWNSRYRGLRPGQLDAISLELFSMCAAKGVPILAHCTPDGFQAVKGYGAMSSPANWRVVLERFPDLRLCLAHAGGGSSWFTNDPWSGSADFDQLAWDLATSYENVYLDFSYADEILDPKKRAAFEDRLVSLLARDDRRYALGDKIIYGSDWHMISALDSRTRILAELRALFAKPAFAGYHGRFFAGNAARFLRLASYVESAPLSDEQRSTLRTLLARIQSMETSHTGLEPR